MTQYLVFDNPVGAPGAFLQKQVIVNWSNIKYIEPIDTLSFKLQLNNGGNIVIGAAVAKASEVVEKIRDVIKSQPGGKVLEIRPDFSGQWNINSFVYTPPSNGSTAPYKVISQIISQTGTSAPTVDRELENTTGTTFTWGRFNAGVYRIIAADPVFNFPFRTQVFLNMGNIQLSADPIFISHGNTSDTSIEINTWDATTLNLADTGLQFASFEAHIYPI